MFHNIDSLMKEEHFTVNYLSTKDGFLYFSEYWSKRLCYLNNSRTALKVDYQNGKHAYFSWSPQPLSKADNSVVQLSATYAQKLGIQNGEKVQITFYNYVPTISRVFVSPASQDDFEILAVNQDLLQTGLLDQIQIVWPGQEFVAWVGSSMYAVLRVDDMEPKSEVGRLQTLTEVIVNPPCIKESSDNASEMIHKDLKIRDNSASCVSNLAVNNNNNAEIHKGASVVTLLWGSIQGISSKLLGIEEKSDKISNSSVSSASCEPKKNSYSDPVSYRVHPIEITDEASTCSALLQPFNMFLRKIYFPHSWLDFGTGSIVKLEKVLIEKSSHRLDDEKEPSKSEESYTPVSNIYVRLCVVEDLIDSIPNETRGEVARLFKNSGQKCVYLSKVARAALQVKVGGRVRMEIHLDPLKEPPTEVELLPAVSVGVNSTSLEGVWKSYMQKLCEAGEVLLSSNSIIPLCSSSYTVYHTRVTIKEPEVPYATFSASSLEKCKVNISLSQGNYVPIPTIEDNNLLYKDEYHYFGHLEEEIKRCRADLEITLGLAPVPWSLERSVVSVINILIVGKSGSGVSSFGGYLCGLFSSPPSYVYCAEIQCRSLKGKKVESIQQILASTLAECNLHQPAILLLHDLDTLVASSKLEQEASTENLYSMRVGNALVDLLGVYQPQHQIAVVATAGSSSKLSSTLMSARGQHTFLTVVEIPDLTKGDRFNILQIYLDKKVGLGYDDKVLVDLQKFAKKSDGFVVQDLADFMEKAVFEAWKRSTSAGMPDSLPYIESADLERAFEQTTPLGLHDVNLVRDSSLSWDDIGGLENAKTILKEMLELPAQFPELFAQAPLRLQSGLLLYGPPGTGKTMLAGAVAKECGLNFISVKGPELLSKFIGASEEGVRNIFQKAQSAKPCVLFFDEFDSLAPRRGHDSTGVTDRVVNQLLTQMDGVESLTGVWVLAASSRPDLLDPALLRPGRIDRSVLCPVPSEADRLSILKSLSRRMTLTDDVDLAALAKNTPNFTGADLQSVLYTAQLMAVEELEKGDMTPTEHEHGDFSARAMASTSSDGPSSKVLVVTRAHLEKALSDTRPSLSAEERTKYEIIYNRFERSGSGSILNAMNLPVMKQKVTLA